MLLSLSITLFSYSFSDSLYYSLSVILSFSVILSTSVTPSLSAKLTLSVCVTITHSHTLLITCTCCYGQIEGTQDKDFSCSFSDSLSLCLSLSTCCRWASQTGLNSSIQRCCVQGGSKSILRCPAVCYVLSLDVPPLTASPGCACVGVLSGCASSL